MTRKEKKHRDELGKASIIISELGYVPDESMCSDKPDIFLHKKKNRQIGIEVVAYSTCRYEKSENALYKILNEYTKELDKHSNKRYEIGVLFMDLHIPIDINFNKVKKQIFTELDSLLLTNHPQMDCHYVASLTAMENPGVEHSFISCDSVVVYSELDEQTLLGCITEKGHKLKGYKAKPENSTIQEYYLVVFFPFNEHVELRGYRLPNTYKSEYDRIYLVDDFYSNRIK